MGSIEDLPPIEPSTDPPFGSPVEAGPPAADEPVEAAAESVAEKGPAPVPCVLRPRGDVRPRSYQGVRKIGVLESGALLGAGEVAALSSALDVQAGYLRVLEEATADRPEDHQLVLGAMEARERLEEGLLRFMRCLREGMPDRTEMDLNHALASMIPALAREVGEDSRLLVAPPVGPLPVALNPVFLQRALVHLVQNAREASLPGQRIRLSWGPAPYGSVVDERWEGARIRIEDQGEGISREHFTWLFEPLFSTRSRWHPTRGLGLPVAQAIIEGHGGWIEVRSLPGQGTEVDLYLPLVASPVGDAPSSSAGTQRFEAESAAQRILLLEDESLLAGLLDRILTRAGYDVELCSTEQELERRRGRGDGRIDLMIVERVLSGGRSGVAIAREWQRREPGMQLMVIQRDPSDGPPDSSDSESGDVPILMPPFEPAEVLRRVGLLVKAQPEPPPREPPSPGGSILTH